ncbi:PP2C family protein-serine/threonine phosphatase [Sanguibacter antarcticus]|uniref:Protein phosphatase n=1 Tax=Sanguibacter antarcticus TaxID=372484 RepID=A0A2A9E769_9MICO|nr:protein phosphatase 2C domain-containing protein [Sanguibacter antarcticus]PFG34391.1 protein phosphatase [Sanguibacter antarcticus]
MTRGAGAGIPAGRSPFIARWGAATDRGAVRRVNEDSLLATPPFFLVADGMGGHDAGDIASSIVLDAFSPYVKQTAVTEEDVRSAVLGARRAVVEFFEPTSMSGGSTLTGVAMSTVGDEPALVVVNIGDSRTYRLSDGHLEQLSKDHSTVQELVDAGSLTPEDARTHPSRNVITRAISPTADSEPDVWSVPARPGDRFLACSDGLTGEISDEHIHDILAAHDDPQAAAGALVDAALAEEARDNITVVVVDVVALARSADEQSADATGADGGTGEHGADDHSDIEDTIPTVARG